MTKVRFFLIFTLFSLLTVTFLGCAEELEDDTVQPAVEHTIVPKTPSENTESSESTEVIRETPLEGNYLLAHVVFPSFPNLSKSGSSDVTSRSAFPAISQLSGENITFSALLSETDGTSYESVGVYDAESGVCSFAFNGAYNEDEDTNYTLTINLFSSSGGEKELIASGSQSVLVAAASYEMNANVSLAPNVSSSLKGGISLKLSFDNEDVSTVELLLTNSEGNDVTSTYLGGTSLAVSDKKVSIVTSTNNLPGGTYILLMTFKKGIVTVGNRTESLNIYPSLITNAWWSNGSSIVASDTLSVNTYNQTEFWVRGTGGKLYSEIYKEAAAANDNNIGTFSLPLETVQEAVNRIQTIGDGSTEYTIWIDGEVTGVDRGYDESNKWAFVCIGASNPQKITIKGFSSSDTDIINANQSDASGDATAVYVLGTADVTIENLKITGGNIKDGNGGGIYKTGSGTLTINDCDITGNTATGGGGGVYVDANATFKMSGGSISGNSATSGGGVYTRGALTISGGEISGNSAEANGGGIGIASTTIATISGTRIYNNSASKTGGGICIFEKSGNGCEITGATILENKAGTSGGGVYNNSGTLIIAGSTSVKENTADSYGGGVCIKGGTFSIDSGSISANTTTTGNGAGVGAIGAYVQMTGGTITENVAAKNGGGIFITKSDAAAGSFEMTGGTISANTANYEYGGGGGVYIDANCSLAISGGTISGNSSSEYGGAIVLSSATGTISGDDTLIKSNSAAKNGGGIYSYNSGLTMQGGVVRDNHCEGNGGGVAVEKGNDGTSTFTMSGGTLSGNYLSGETGTGGAISVADTFIMSGSASIPYGGSVGKNDVYLSSGKMIDVPTALSASPAATITPNKYEEGIQVLGGSALSSEYTKFNIAQPGNSVKSWIINSEGKLQNIISSLYISENGSDESGDGSKDNPFKTVRKAVGKFSLATAAVSGTDAAPVFTNKIYALSDITITSGAGTDVQAYFEIVGMKSEVEGKAVTFTCNTPNYSSFYLQDNQKVKFTNINFTQNKSVCPLNKYAVLLASEQSELWVENCSFTGLHAEGCSCIVAEGPVHLKDVTIQGNTTVGTVGGDSVWGPAVYSKQSPIYIQGKVVISGNSVKYSKNGSDFQKEMNVWIGDHSSATTYFNPLILEDSIFESSIGITLYDSSADVLTSAFTSGYKTYETAAASKFFTSDDGYSITKTSSGEASMTSPKAFYVSQAGNDETGTGSKDNPYASIERAVGVMALFNDNSKDCKINIVGTVSESATLTTDAEMISDGKGTKLVGTSLTIQGSNSSSSILAASGTDSILTLSYSGIELTLYKLGFTGANSTNSGGAVSMRGNGKLYIKNCAFTNNKTTTATTMGGALYVGEQSTVEISGTSFSGNECAATDSGGGAIYINSGGTVKFTSGTVSGNKAQNGGGIYNLGKLTISGGTLSANEASSNGGGVCNKGTLTMSGGSISANSASGNGGGVASVDGVVTMSGTASSIAENTANAGGGVWIKQDTGTSTFTMNSGSVSGNKAFGGGAGFMNQLGTLNIKSGTISGNIVTETDVGTGGGILTLGAVNISGGTIKENSALHGGAVYVYADADYTGNLIMSGAPSIPAGSDGKNDVYLNNVITIGGSITGTAPVATITPNAYMTGVQVLQEGGGSVKANYRKFALTASGDGSNWNVNSEGKLSTETPEKEFIMLTGSEIRSVLYSKLSMNSYSGPKSFKPSATAPASGTTTYLISAAESDYLCYVWKDGTAAYYYAEGYTDSDKGIPLHEDSSGMFKDLTNIQTVDMRGFDTSNVANMSNMFYGCTALTSVNMNSWNTENLTNTNGMFRGCSKLTSIDLNDWNTESLKDSSYMFYSCVALTSIDLSSWNTQSLTDASYMFYYCSALTSIDLNDWDTESLTDSSYMFYKCSALTSVDLSGWNARKLTTAKDMFASCKLLTSIDLSGWNAMSLANTYEMFDSCSALTTIYASASENWSGTVTDGQYTFYGCSKLVGGSGTKFSSSYTNAARARVDGGTAAPGYFTAKE